MIMETAYLIFNSLLLAGACCCLWRLWQGPSLADRINAADVLALCFVGFALGHGWKQADPLWLDVALVVGLVLFVGTTALSVCLRSEDLAQETKQ